MLFKDIKQFIEPTDHTYIIIDNFGYEWEEKANECDYFRLVKIYESEGDLEIKLEPN